MAKTTFGKYIVWVDYGGEGWSPVDSFDEWESATESLLEHMGNGNPNVVITEYIPVKVVPASVVKE